MNMNQEIQNVKNKIVKGFTLIEMIVVMAIIAVLAAILVPTIGGYLEMANNAVDISNAHSIENALRAYSMFDPDGAESLQESNVWGYPNNYVYVDDIEIRCSSMALAKVLEGEGLIRDAEHPSRERPGKNGKKEPCYAIATKDTYVVCKSKKAWKRYQVDFVYKDGGFVFTYRADRNGATSKNVQDEETSKLFALKMGRDSDVTTGNGMGNR